MQRVVAAAVGIAIELTGRRVAAGTLAPTIAGLAIDDVAKGDAVILVDSDDARDVWIPASLLCEARLCRAGGIDLPAPPFGGAAGRGRAPTIDRDGTRYVDLRELVPDVHYTLDAEAGTLAVHLARSALAPTTIELASRAPAGITYPSAPSAYVNYALDGSLRGDGGPTALFSGFAETGLSAAGMLAYSAVAMPDADRVVRGLSRISAESRDDLVSVDLGEDVVAGGLLGGGGVIAGLHVHRDLGLDPYFVARPTLTANGEVQTPSTIEIYRDGQLVRREIIPAGPYTVSDLTGPIAGDTRVVVRDVFGLTQATVTTLGAPPPAALAPGLHDFSYSLGVMREQLALSSFDYGAPAALAVHRVGITRWLTLGARAEGTPERGSGGATAIAYAGRFSFEGDAAASAAHASHASAAAAFDLGWHRDAWTLSGRVRTTGARYTTLDLAPTDDRPLLDTGAAVTWAAGHRVSMYGELAFDRMRDSGTRARASLSATALLTPRAHLLATASAGEAPGGPQYEVTTSVAFSIDARTTAIATAAAAGAAAGGSSLIASIDHAMGGVRGIGYDADIRAGDSSQADARVVAQGDHGRIDASASWVPAGPRGDVAISGGIVAVGGVVRAVRPVRGGFALVRAPGAPGARITLDNQVVGALDANGNAIIPELQPYYGNRIGIDVRDVPATLGMRDLERVVGPPRLGGAIVEFAPAQVATVRGRIAASVAGHATDASFGELVLDPGADEVRAPIGHGGVFEIEDVHLGHHRVRVDLDGASCERDLAIGAAGELDLGAVACALGGMP